MKRIQNLVRVADVLFLCSLVGTVAAPLLFLTLERRGAFPLLTDLATRSRAGDVLSMYLALAVALWSGLLVLITLHWTRKLILRKSGRLKSQINVALARVENRPPVLLLRSFFKGSLAKTPRVENPYSNYGGMIGHDPIVKVVERELSQFGRPVAIGYTEHEAPDIGDHEIVFLSTTDASWRQVFLSVAALSRFILVVPGWTTGLLLEMRTIRAEHLDGRTIVYMPPSPATSPDRRAFVRDWARAREAAAECELDLPPYDERGMLYVPASDFSIRYSASLEASDPVALPTRMTLAIANLLGKLNGDYGTVAAAIARAETEFDASVQ